MLYAIGFVIVWFMVSIVFAVLFGHFARQENIWETLFKE